MDQRKYQMTRIEAGDYLVPSNDSTELWRFTRYEEDGSLADDDGGNKVVGMFWRAGRFNGTLDQAQALMNRDPDEFLDWSRWFEQDSLLPSRKAAIEVMLRAGERKRNAPTPGSEVRTYKIREDGILDVSSVVVTRAEAGAGMGR
jgi:hypothetical protein